MGNLKTFQVVILGIFIALAVVSVVIFAGFSGFGGQSLGSVEIWGTTDDNVMNRLFDLIRAENDQFSNVTYLQKNPDTYDDELVEALAAGKGPDLFMLSDDSILRQDNKLVPIPYDLLSEREFRDTFLEEGELFLREDGIRALPFLVDPLITYWNRNLFSREGIASTPRYWDELFTIAPKLTKRDDADNITQSAVAFGEYRNVTNAKGILSALLMQAGTPIVAPGERGYDSLLRAQLGFTTPPAEAALRFFTEFSNPVKTVYSWNRSLPAAKQSFIAGDLALYFGYASEVLELRTLNPNLNFDVAPLPQSRDTAASITYGRMAGLAISRGSDNVEGAYGIARILTNSSAVHALAGITGLPPVRRDLLSSPPTDAFQNLTYSSALISQGWFDPDRDQTNRIFREMVENITSGREQLSSAISIADRELSQILERE